MISKIFGTDGIRAKFGSKYVNVDSFLDFGKKIGAYLCKNNKNQKTKVLIGIDTRYSSTILMNSLSLGFQYSGVNVLYVDIVPSSLVGFLVNKHHCDLGIMITASHNPYNYNGMKFFNTDGSKYNKKQQEELEQCLLSKDIVVQSDKLGRFSVLNDVLSCYVDHILSLNYDLGHLQGKRILIDLAYGSGYYVVKKLFNKLNLNITYINDNYDGYNINLDSGSNNPDILVKKIKEGDYDLGLAFDGDADRLIMLDKSGNEINGDIVMINISLFLMKHKRLQNNAIVATDMSNRGLISFLKKKGIEVFCSEVGDIQVYELMKEKGINFGGEPSGHIIYKDLFLSSDGLLTAYLLLSSLVDFNLFDNAFFNFNQRKLVNLNISDKLNDVKKIELQILIDKLKDEMFKDDVYSVIRLSGTEPLIRILIESSDKDKLDVWSGIVLKKLKSILS